MRRLPPQDQARRKTRAVVALKLGLVALLIGTGLFVAVVVPPFGPFLGALGALATILVGVAFLMRALWSWIRSAEVLTPNRLGVGLVGTVGLAILPVGVMALALMLIPPSPSVHVIVVANESGRPLENARIIGAGHDEALGTIASGEELRWEFSVDEEGAVQFTADLAGSALAESVDTMLHGGGGATLTVKPDGTVEVEAWKPDWD